MGAITYINNPCASLASFRFKGVTGTATVTGRLVDSQGFTLKVPAISILSSAEFMFNPTDVPLYDASKHYGFEITNIAGSDIRCAIGNSSATDPVGAGDQVLPIGDYSTATIGIGQVN